MFKFTGLVLLLFLLSMKVEAQGARVVLGEDSIRLIYITEAWGQEIGNLDVGTGILIADDNLVHLGVAVRHQTVDSALKLSIGGRLYYSDIAGKNPLLFAFGGSLLLMPSNLSRLGIGLSYFTAPGVTTFTDADSFTEYSVSLHYQITPQANLYFGYQLVNIQLSNESDDRDFEKGSFFGLRIDF
ncbi:hypothetical protein JYT31_01970 [Beggiatoa alba]|nr:hypothetical protein [Beggiatoa alba]